MMETDLQGRLSRGGKVLVGLGEEWKLPRGGAPDGLLRAYEALYRLLKDRDYFIVTMATDGLIFHTPLGSRQETVAAGTEGPQDKFSCELGGFSCESVDEKTLERMNRIFPVKEQGTGGSGSEADGRPSGGRPAETRFQRIVAPCGNETWRQCSVGCTKDIWEPGEIPDDICPHCGAPLTGNTVEAHPYIEEGYLPQWNRYLQWLAGTLNGELTVLELGVGFANPGVVRFPFEKTVYFNRKACLYRVNASFPQTAKELAERAVGIKADSVAWVTGQA